MITMVTQTKTKIERDWNDWKSFLSQYKNLPNVLAVMVLLVYGIRIVHDNIFLDSELMVLLPDFMHDLWISSNRFGLTFTSKLFGMSRLVPYLAAALMALMMFFSALLFSYCLYNWSGCDKRYCFFYYICPILFIVSPIFAEQYLFILQAFEIAFAIFLCIFAAFAITNWIYGKRDWYWLILGIVCMVWSFASYQAILPLYIALVLMAYLLHYIHDSSEKAFQYGIAYVVTFLGACIIYVVVNALVKRVMNLNSTYISSMIQWSADNWKTSLLTIKSEIGRVFKGETVFFSKLYLPFMLLFVGQMAYLGWKKKTTIGNYLCFLFAGGMLLLSPFLLTIIMGSRQAMRSQLVYPVVFAFVLTHLTLWETYQKVWKKLCILLVQIICIFSVIQTSTTTVQLFQSSWEAYRNDVLTMNRMYDDICEIVDATDEKDVTEYKMIFVGGRDSDATKNQVLGELAGMSLFRAEAHTQFGVSGRVGNVFSILGMDMRIMTQDDEELYKEAIAQLEDAPIWPKEGSIQKMGENIIIIKLS